MVLNEVVQRFIEHSPVTVMARVALQSTMSAQWLDELFEQHSQRQYKRELLFSSVVELMSLVAVGLRPSVHAAAKAAKELPVSLTALYEKIGRTELGLIRALVSQGAQRLGEVRQSLGQQQGQQERRWRVRVVDGSHLRGTQKRVGALRGFRGAALPGQSLVVYDPDTGLVVDMLPCEDAHEQERTLMAELVGSAQAGQLWVADRNFCTRALLGRWQEQGSGFIVREHAANARPSALGQAQPCGRCESGLLYEQPVSLPRPDGSRWELRRIELRLDEAGEDGQRVIRLLCNLPAHEISAHEVAQMYRRRWRIENMFQRLESVLNSEIATLGQPRAALLAFGVAVLAYNALAVIQHAIAAAQPQPTAVEAVSTYFLAQEVRTHYAGMLVATPPEAWHSVDRMSCQQLAALLRSLAAKVPMRSVRTHHRADKPTLKKGYAPASQVRRHVATARVMAKGGVR